MILINTYEQKLPSVGPSHPHGCDHDQTCLQLQDQLCDPTDWLQLQGPDYQDQAEHQLRRHRSLLQIWRYWVAKVDGKSQEFAKEFDEWVNQYNGVFRVGAVDCDEYPKICKEEKAEVFPSFKIYPPTPMPTTTITEDYSVEKLQKAAARYLHSNVIEITNANLHTFTAENPSVPKVLLFTDKKGVPMVYKGLSVAF